MAYNKNTNYENERTYLNNLISGGGGNAEWAKKQMKELDAAEAKYGSTGTTNSTASSTASKTSSSSGSSKTSGTPSGFVGSAAGITTNTVDQDAIKEQMNANSEAWWSATAEEQAQLHAANEALAKLLEGDNGAISYDSVSGKWSGTAGTSEAVKPATSSSAGSISGAKNYTDFVSEPEPEYTNQYEDVIGELVEEILARDPFSYNAANDPLYQFYSDYYQRNGDLAMRDTAGELASRTGGLASSYAGSAAQQTYNSYMQGLNDIVPELYNLAYSMYQDEANGERANLEMLQALEQGDYAKYLDLLSQYNVNRNFDYGILSDQIGLDYQRDRDTVSDAQWQQSFDYQAQRDALEDAQWQQSFDLSQQKANNSSAGGGDDAGGEVDIYDLFRAADEFAKNGGDPEDFIRANYRDYGIGSATEAISKYNVYLVDGDGSGSGYNSAYFRQAMASLGTMLAQGNAEGAIGGIDSLWSKLNTEQKRQVQELLANYGYSYEED